MKRLFIFLPEIAVRLFYTEIQGRVHDVPSFLHTFPCIIDI